MDADGTDDLIRSLRKMSDRIAEGGERMSVALSHAATSFKRIEASLRAASDALQAMRRAAGRSEQDGDRPPGYA